MELKEAIERLRKYIDNDSFYTIYKEVQEGKRLGEAGGTHIDFCKSIETVLQALKEKEEINESHQKENGKLQVELSEKDETISVLEFNYKNLNADIGGIAQELGLEEDATIDEMHIAIRELQDKLSKADKMIDLTTEYISNFDNDETICAEINCAYEDCREGCDKRCIKQYFKEKVKKGE